MGRREETVASSRDLPQVVPVFPLAGAILLPHASRPFNIFEPRYLNMIDDAMAAERIIGMVQPAMGVAGSPERPFLSQVGCAGRITSFTETGDGRYLITLTGVSRFRLGEELPAGTPYRRVRADFLPFAADLEPMGASEGPREDLLGPLRRYLEPRELTIEWSLAETAPIGPLINSLIMALPFGPPEQQALLEAPTPDDRRRMLIALLRIDGPFGGEDPPPLQ